MNKFDKALDYFQHDSYDEFKERYPEIGDMYRKMSVIIGEEQLEVVREALKIASNLTNNPYTAIYDPQEAFDTLTDRLNKPAKVLPEIKKLMAQPPVWDRTNVSVPKLGIFGQVKPVAPES